MERLDEVQLRRADFDASGYAVELADGQKYKFPRVRIRVMPEERDDGSIGTGYRPWYAGAMEAELDVLFGVVEADDMEYVAARLKIAAHLLRANYDLPKGALARLLPYLPGDPASESMLDRVSVAVMGGDPDRKDREDTPDPNAVTPPGSP